VWQPGLKTYENKINIVKLACSDSEKEKGYLEELAIFVKFLTLRSPKSSEK